MKLVFVALAFFAVSLACVYGQDLPICWVRGICVGSIFATFVAKTYNDCLRLCKAESECKWATFFIVGHACFLFDECFEVDDKNDLCITSQQHCEIANSKVLVATGRNASDMADIEVIDLLTHEVTCEKLQNFPRAEYLSAGGLGFDEKPLICGGLSGSGSSSCYLYENGAWGTSDSLKQGRYGFAMTKYPSKVGSSKLFLTGGQYSSSSYLSSTEVLIENGWQTSVPLPGTIYYHCMVAVNSSSPLVIGGKQNNALSGASYYFNSETNIWSEGPTLGVPRMQHSCGAIRRHNNTQERTPIAVGGEGINSTEVLNTNTWTRGPNLPFAIDQAALVEDPSGGVVLIGGIGNGKSLETLYRLPHAGSDATWEEMPQKLKTARYDHTAFLVPDEIANCN